MTKLLENTFRHVNIALVNELAMFAADMGIDVWEAIGAASTKPFGFMPLHSRAGGRRPLPAHRPVVPVVAGQAPTRPQLSLRRVGQRRQRPHARYVVRRLTSGLNRRRQAVNGSRIFLLGMAYKRNTSDSRESPAIVVAERLVAAGPTSLRPTRTSRRRVVPVRGGRDPRGSSVRRRRLLLTDHDPSIWPALAYAARYFLDTRHRVSGSSVEHL